MRFRISFHLAKVHYDAGNTMHQLSDSYMPRAAYGDVVYFELFCAFWLEVSIFTRLIKATSRMSKFSELRKQVTNQTFRHQTPVLSAPGVLYQSALLCPFLTSIIPSMHHSLQAASSFYSGSRSSSLLPQAHTATASHLPFSLIHTSHLMAQSGLAPACQRPTTPH